MQNYGFLVDLYCVLDAISLYSSVYVLAMTQPEAIRQRYTEISDPATGEIQKQVHKTRMWKR